MTNDEWRLAFQIGYRVARKHRGPGLDVEDLASRTAIKAAQAWDNFVDAGEGSRERWLATIALHVVKDAKRRTRTEAMHQESLKESQSRLAMAVRALSPDSVAANGEKARLRRELYSALPSELKTPFDVVADQHAGEMSRREAAEVLGLSLATYDKTATKVKHALRDSAAAAGFRLEQLIDIDQAQERTAE
jgi:RNA polymerase sigma factor (sigma-70 family)